MSTLDTPVKINDNYKKTVQKCFTQVPGRPDFWKCGCGKILKQEKATGWTNLVAHIRTQHGESSPPSSQKTLQFQCKKSETVFGWLRLVCLKSWPFSNVECPIIREQSKFDKISKNTLLKYLHLTSSKVEQEIGKLLPDKLALTIDGWTENSNHFVGIMTSFLNSSNLCQTVLLAFSPMADESTQGAEEMS